MSETAVRRRRPAGENRRRLLEAGVHDFGRFGYHGASTSRIAERANVPQPHLYASYPNKQALFLACVDVAVGILDAQVVVRTAIDVADGDALRLLFQAFGVLGDPKLREALLPRLKGVEDSYGERRFAEALARGATLLLEGDDTDAELT